MKYRLLLFSMVMCGSLAMSGQFARVQIIHNCADAAAASVDIYANGSLAISGLDFREATPFEDIPGGVPLDIAVVPAGSSLANAAATFDDVVFNVGETYVVVANGIVSASGYSPSQPFTLDVFPGARESAAVSGQVDVLALHGATDAPAVDVLETAVLGATAIDDLEYREFAGYLELPAADYRLAVATSDQSAVVASFEAPLQTLGLSGSAVTVVASGFLNPAANSDGPAFGLWAALPDGGQLVQLPVSTCRVQVIHNCADAIASEVDVYLNGEILLDDFAFRSSSPFVDALAGVPVSIAIAGSDSESVDDALVTFNYDALEHGETYVIVANGIASPSGYSPSPQFDLDIFAGGRETATQPGNVDVLVLHGATDAPAVDVSEDNLGLTLVDDLAYGSFDGYLELGLANYVLNVTSTDGTTPYFSYRAPLASLSLQGQAVTVVASGFLDPSVNSEGASFGLWVSLASGGALIPLPVATARVQVIHNSPDPLASSVDLYVGAPFTPLVEVQDLGFREATPFVSLPANVGLDVIIAPGNSSGPQDEVVSAGFTLDEGESYILTASGLLVPDNYNPSVPFSIEVFTGARETAQNSGETDILVLHGSTDAPAVDVNEETLGITVIENLEYAEYEGYLSLPTADYVVGIAPTGGENIALFSAPLASLSLQDAALTVVASGFLDPGSNEEGPEFGLWVALPSGGDLVQLPAYLVQEPARVQVIHNAADELAATVDVYIESDFSAPIILDNFAFRTASPFVDVISAAELTISVALPDSDGPEDAIGTFNVTLEPGEKYIVVANGMVSASGYNPSPDFDLDIFAGAREEANVPANTDVLVYHGCTDAPVVDVAESSIPAGTLVDDLSYREFAGYLELAPLDYVVDIIPQPGTDALVSYSAPLESLSLEGTALCVLASGFLDPAQNSNGPGFGLWVALPSGGDLIELPVFVGVGENELVSGLMTFPNPAVEALTITGQLLEAGDVTIELVDAAGRTVATEGLNAGQGYIRHQVNTSGLTGGLYSLRMIQGDATQTIRFSVIR